MGEARRRALELPAVVWRSMRGIRSMPRESRREYFVVVALAVTTEAALRLGVDARRLTKAYGIGLAEPAPTPSDAMDGLPAWATRRLRIVRKVMHRWPVDGECLRESLVAGQRLRSMSPQLRFGVIRSNGSVQAHAWLEVNGSSLDPSSGKYAQLPI